MSTIEANKRLARRFAETFSNCDYGRWAELIADDAVYEFPGSSVVSGVHTKPRMLEMLKSLAAVFPSGIKLEIRTMTAEEDRISVEARGSAVSVGGVPYNNAYHFMFVIRDGRIQEAREYLDTKLVDKLLAPGAGL